MACATDPTDGSTDYGDDDKADGAKAIKYPDGISPGVAREMRLLVKAAAKQAWSCNYNAVTATGHKASATGLAYTLAVQPADLGGPEADTRRDYSVAFNTTATVPNPDDASMPIDAASSMMVGYISFVDPTLEKIKTGGKVGYNYTFGGVYTDLLQVIADGHGSAASLLFEKSLEGGGIVSQISCKPHS